MRFLHNLYVQPIGHRSLPPKLLCLIHYALFDVFLNWEIQTYESKSSDSCEAIVLILSLLSNCCICKNQTPGSFSFQAFVM